MPHATGVCALREECEQPVATASVIGVIDFGAIVRGQREGKWVRLRDTRGYLLLCSEKGHTLLTEKHIPHPVRFSVYQNLDIQQQAQEIIPNLWVGPRQVAQRLDDLENLGIKAIVSVFDQPSEYEMVGCGVVPKTLFSVADSVESGDAMANLLSGAVNLTLRHVRQGSPVLLHCASGLSRSATVAIGVVMADSDRGLACSYDIVFKQRPVINPNDGFVEALRVYARDLGRDDNFPKEVYDAYQLVAQLRFKNVTLEQARLALQCANNDVGRAAASLLT